MTPYPLEVVVIYRDIRPPTADPFCGQHPPHCDWEPGCFRHDWHSELGMGNDRFRRQLNVLREMYSVRDFHLVFCLDDLDCRVEYAKLLMGRLVKEEKARGGFNPPFCEPLIICERRVIRTRDMDPAAGWSRTRSTLSAL